MRDGVTAMEGTGLTPSHPDRLGVERFAPVANTALGSFLALLVTNARLRERRLELAGSRHPCRSSQSNARARYCRHEGPTRPRAPSELPLRRCTDKQDRQMGLQCRVRLSTALVAGGGRRCRRDGQSGCPKGVLHRRERTGGRRGLAVVVLTEQPPGQR